MGLLLAWRDGRRERGERLLGPKVELPGGLRQWTQDSMQWLVDESGAEPLCRAVLVPSTFVPED